MSQNQWAPTYWKWWLVKGTTMNTFTPSRFISKFSNWQAIVIFYLAISPTNFKIYSKTNDGNLNTNCSGQLLSKKHKLPSDSKWDWSPKWKSLSPWRGHLKLSNGSLPKTWVLGVFLLHILVPLSPFVVPSLPNPPMAPLDLLGRHPKWSSKVMVETQVCWSQNEWTSKRDLVLTNLKT